jgi:hypothetical protein
MDELSPTPSAAPKQKMGEKTQFFRAGKKICLGMYWRKWPRFKRLKNSIHALPLDSSHI